MLLIKTEQGRFKIDWQMDLIIPTVSAGLITGIIAVIRSISYSSLIFAGPLAQYLGAGVDITVFSTAIISMTVGILSSFPGMIASPIAPTAALFGLISTSLVTQMKDHASLDEICWTLMSAIALSAILTGFFLIILAKFGIGNLIKQIPQAVSGGFLAGTGILLLRGGFQVMTGIPLNWDTWPSLSDSVMIWGTGLIFGLILMIVTKRISHYLVMPLSIIIGIILVYSYLSITHTSIAIAQQEGWLLNMAVQHSNWHPLDFDFISSVNWNAIKNQWGNIIAIIWINAFTLLIRVNAMEVMTQKSIDVNRELQAAGIANLVTGLSGGMGGTHIFVSSSLAYKMGAKSRLVGLFTAIPSIITLVLGSEILSMFPKPVLGGLLICLGLSFIWDWLYKSFFKMPKLDYGLVVIIFGLMIWLGFVWGICLGLIIAVVMKYIFNINLVVNKN